MAGMAKIALPVLERFEPKSRGTEIVGKPHDGFTLHRQILRCIATVLLTRAKLTRQRTVGTEQGTPNVHGDGAPSHHVGQAKARPAGSSALFYGHAGFAVWGVRQKHVTDSLAGPAWAL